MANEPNQNGSGESDEVAALKKENAELRHKLERARFEADLYREEAYKRFNELNPDAYVPPTEEELHDMLHGPRGEPLLDIIEEFKTKYLRGQE